MLRLFVEEERNERAFEALTRFLSAVDAIPAGCARPCRPSIRSRSRSSSSSCGSPATSRTSRAASSAERSDELVGYLPRAGGAVCSACAPDETVFLSPEGFRGIHALLWNPLADAHGLGLGERALRDTLAVVVASYEFHGGFRLRTLTA